MEAEKNRFSQLLEQIMNWGEIKNASLAKALQYDVSYISKWISGRILPAEKNKRNVLRRISKEVVQLSSKTGKENLYENYQIWNDTELEEAIFDNLEAEYNFVQDMQRAYGSSIEPKTIFFAELSPAQYIAKMHHPVLRRVSQLHITAEMDLLALTHEYRLQIIQGNIRRDVHAVYPDVHFSLMVDLCPEKIDYAYDPIFLINMMSDMACIDFQLYKGAQAAGRLIFAVEDEFMISGMLMDANRCMAVTVSSAAENCSPMYHSIRDLCTREMLLYRSTTMQEMIEGKAYVRAALSLHQKWIIGHVTEHFLPDDLFEELLEPLKVQDDTVQEERMRYFHTLTKKTMETTKISIVLHSTALANLAVDGELDFFDYPIYLTLKQRKRCLQHVFELCAQQKNLRVKMVYGCLVSDFQYAVTQCVFLSDTVCYARLHTENRKNNLAVFNHPDMNTIFLNFFETMWSAKDKVMCTEIDSIRSFIHDAIERIEILSYVDKPKVYSEETN